MKYFKFYQDSEIYEIDYLLKSNDRSAGAFKWSGGPDDWVYDGDLVASAESWKDEEIVPSNELTDYQRRSLVETLFTKKWGWLE